MGRASGQKLEEDRRQPPSARPPGLGRGPREESARTRAQAPGPASWPHRFLAALPGPRLTHGCPGLYTGHFCHWAAQ